MQQFFFLSCQMIIDYFKVFRGPKDQQIHRHGGIFRTLVSPLFLWSQFANSDGVSGTFWPQQIGNIQRQREQQESGRTSICGSGCPPVFWRWRQGQQKSFSEQVKPHHGLRPHEAAPRPGREIRTC